MTILVILTSAMMLDYSSKELRGLSFRMNVALIDKLKAYGVGRRKVDDVLFIDMPPSRLGIYDEDDEDLCHAMLQTTCTVIGCDFTGNSLLDYENHYNSSHRYSCSECKKVLPSPHFLDLHIQEQHDSFFAVMAVKKPSYSCYIEECKEKFMTPEERLSHCVKTHKVPNDFRFDQKPRKKNKNKKNANSMDVDKEISQKSTKKFVFNNSKQRAFKNYSGKKFTNDHQDSTASVDLDQVMADIKNSLPI